jgi:beta-lactamase class A
MMWLVSSFSKEFPPPENTSIAEIDTATTDTRATTAAALRETSVAEEQERKRRAATATADALNEAATAIDATQTMLAEATRGAEQAARITQVADLERTMEAIQATQTEQAQPTATPRPPTPTPVPPLPTPTPAPPSFPRGELESILNAANGFFGVVVYDITDERLVYTRNEDEQFSATALINLPVAVTVYRMAYERQLSLSERLTLSASDIVGGTGTLQQQRVGSSYSLQELCERMLIDSDNTATNMLLRRIGGFDAVNHFMEEINVEQTRVQRFMMDLDAIQQGRDNLTSPADMAQLLRLIEQGSLIGSSGREDILDALRQNENRSKIPAYLPASNHVYNRTGVLPAPDGVEHDVAIVVLPSERRYIVVLMGAHLPDNAAGVQAIARASQLIHEYEASLD